MAYRENAASIISRNMRLVDELPPKDGRVVSVLDAREAVSTGDDRFDVVCVPATDDRVREEVEDAVLIRPLHVLHGAAIPALSTGQRHSGSLQSHSDKRVP